MIQQCKRIWLTTVLSMLIICCKAQTMYKVQYQIATHPSTQYEALLVLNGIGGGFARINFISPNNGQPTTVATSLQEMDAVASAPPLMAATTGFAAVMPQVLKGDTAWQGAPIVFWFVADSNYALQPLGVAEAGRHSAEMHTPFTTAVMLHPDSLSKAAVLPFFNRRDSVYQRLFTGPSRGPANRTAGITMHLIIVANVNDATIGPSTAKDMEAMIKLMTGLAGDMKIKMAPIIIAGNNYNKKNLLNALAKLTPGPNDIMVFYYSGHGFRKSTTPLDRLPKDSIFPYLDLRANSKEDYLVQSVGIDSIYHLLQRKGARLNLVIADCCNTEVEITNVEAEPPGQPRGPVMQRNMRNLEMLFLNPNRSSILTTAANVAERASSNNSFGGFFTYFFRAALNFYVSPMRLDPPTWEQLLQDARTETAKKARRTYCDKPFIPANICRQNAIINIQ